MLKKLTNSYGSFVLETTVVTALILLFLFLPAGDGKYGIGNVLSGKVESDGIDYSSYADSSAAANVLGQSKPVIKYYPYDASGTKVRIVTEKDVVLTSYFKCTDTEGSDILNVKITSIKDKTGTELLSDKLTTADTFRFTSSGIYDIEVVATDSRNQYSIMKISVPVASKRQEG